MKKYIYILVAMSIALASCSQKKENAASDNTQAETSVKDKPWQEITPLDIEGNPVKMFADDWFELAAGKEGDMNLMTIAWGTIGELWSRPVVTVYVSTSRYTYEFMGNLSLFIIGSLDNPGQSPHQLKPTPEGQYLSRTYSD